MTVIRPVRKVGKTPKWVVEMRKRALLKFRDKRRRRKDK